MEHLGGIVDGAKDALQGWGGPGAIATGVGTTSLSVYKWGGKVFKKLWPGRELWGSDAVLLPGGNKDSRLAWKPGVHDRWTTFRPQEAGWWYRLDLGRVTTIERVVFDHARSFKDYPSRFRLELSADGEHFVTSEHAGPIDVKLEPLRVRYIRVTILEPQQDTTMYNAVHWWSIHDVRVYERRSKFWLVPI